MADQAPKLHITRPFGPLIWVALLILVQVHPPLLGQTNLISWEKDFDQRVQLADYALFQATVDDAASEMPALRQDVPVLDALELALQPWGQDRSRENECMQLLISENAKRLHQLNGLSSLYKPQIDAIWMQTDLPYAFRWIPAVVSQLNHAAVPSDGKRAGLWQNTKADAVEAGLRIDGTVDERGLPSSSTLAAVRTLEKLQRRFPNDPHRVLVAYFRGMAYATRWTGKVGYDENLDELLALYKVICRLMVNTKLEDFSLDWLATSNNWSAPTCTEDWNRESLIAGGRFAPDAITQFIPWWTGSTLNCGELDAYNVRMPDELTGTPAPTVVEKHTPVAPTATDSEAPQEAEYVPGFTCLLHEVKAGDTLWNISKRYPGTTPEWIAEINEITDYIRIGEVLCIPNVQ